MSLNSVVMCVAASYRTLKRGAVNVKSTFFIYLSLLCQVLARIISFLMLYLYQRRFYPAVIRMESVTNYSLFFFRFPL